MNERKLKKIIYVIVILGVFGVSYLINKNIELRDDAVFWEDAYYTTFNKELKIEDCLETVRLEYIDRWDGHCESLGEEKDCLLPGSVADSYDQSLDNNEQLCLEVYK